MTLPQYKTNKKLKRCNNTELEVGALSAQKCITCLLVEPHWAHLQYLCLVEQCGVCAQCTLSTLSTLNFSSASRMHLSCHRPPPLWQYLPTLWSRDHRIPAIFTDSGLIMGSMGLSQWWVSTLQLRIGTFLSFVRLTDLRENPSACSWEALVSVGWPPKSPSTAGEFWIS